MLYPLRTISLSACLIAAVLGLSCQQAAAGFAFNPAFGSNSANAGSWSAATSASNWPNPTMRVARSGSFCTEAKLMKPECFDA